MTPAPLRVVLATVGSRGDVQPMLALAQALAARGHVPVLAAPPNCEAWIRSLGFEFAPVGRDIQAFLAEDAGIMTGNPLKQATASVRYFTDQIPQHFASLKQACEGADALLWAGLAVAAPSVAEHLRLPTFAVFYSTCMVPGQLHPPPTIPWHGMPGWINRALWRVHRRVSHWLIGKPLNIARATVGLPAVRFHEHVFESDGRVFAVDEGVFPADPGWAPGRFPYANFLYFDDPAVLDAELDAWLADGEPPVFVGFGSMSGHGTDRVGRMIVEALAGTGKRCIVGAGWAGLGEGALPPGWRVVRDAPHAQLFPRVAAVVHHGGSGTTAQALRAGVPQVILPLLLDQYHHAHRLFLAGLAPKAVPMERVTAKGLGDAIDAALALPSGPRKAVAERLRASDGRGQIVQRLEALCSG
ncbi:MAG: putative glycosyltransferase [Ramlibacter sp.]|nr:putative glycosyltransferase [Ramlibacter sp.]